MNDGSLLITEARNGTLLRLSVSADGERPPAVTVYHRSIKNETAQGMDSFGIGASVVRREDLRLITGTGCYADDVQIDGALHAAFVRSTRAHARIGSIDVAAAKSLPGVVAVFTGSELAAGGVAPIPTLIVERGGGIRNRDGSAFAEPIWHALATDRVRHVGEPVALVIGRTAADAQDGVEAVCVDYETLPHAVDAVAALAPDAPQLHASAEHNRAYDWETGDPAATARAIAQAAHVASVRLSDNRLVTCFMEPRAALAQWDATADRLTVHAGTQSVHQLAGLLARILGLEAKQVRCITGDVGGGFGSKLQPYPEYIAIAWAARQLGATVRWTSARSEGFISDAQSRDQALEGELALDTHGRILALRVRSVTNLGAYVTSGIPMSTLLNMERMISSLYEIPAIHLAVQGALTNTVPINVYRGVGRIECVYTVERLIEQAARDLGLDALKLRRDNMVPASAFPYRTATGALYDSGDYVARLDEAIALADLPGLAVRKSQSESRGKLRGLGIGPYIEGTGGMPQEYAQVTVLPEGRVDVPLGSQSQGQGHETVFAQVVAERLGIPYDTVHIITGDTDRVARGNGTFASRSMVKAGGAAVEVCDRVIELGRQMAAHLLEVARSDIDYVAGRYQVSGTDHGLDLFAVARAVQAGQVPVTLGAALSAQHMHENPRYAFANGCEVCEVEVDPDTGVVAVLALRVVDDSGRAVSPMIVHGQMHGAIVQGLGQALCERTVYDPASGQLLSGSFMDYTLLRADELPSIEVVSRDVPSPTNALGVKGAGEGGTVGAPGALIHAILDALAPLGVKHIDMPATPERVWRAIVSAKQP